MGVYKTGFSGCHCFVASLVLSIALHRCEVDYPLVHALVCNKHCYGLVSVWSGFRVGGYKTGFSCGTGFGHQSCSVKSLVKSLVKSPRGCHCFVASLVLSIALHGGEVDYPLVHALVRNKQRYGLVSVWSGFRVGGYKTGGSNIRWLNTEQ